MHTARLTVCQFLGLTSCHVFANLIATSPSQVCGQWAHDTSSWRRGPFLCELTAILWEHNSRERKDVQTLNNIKLTIMQTITPSLWISLLFTLPRVHHRCNAKGRLLFFFGPNIEQTALPCSWSALRSIERLHPATPIPVWCAGIASMLSATALEGAEGVKASPRKAPSKEN